MNTDEELKNDPQPEGNERDHKKLGKQLDLYYVDETVGKGLPLFTHKGATIRRELERFIIDEEIRRGYQHVYTPDIAKLDLYIKSGHYPHYKDSMYAPIEIDDEKFMLRPMSCPHHFQLYLSKPRSYRELPMRMGELAKLYRYEQSGELMGLQRTRTFCLADAHIICATEEQAMKEIGGALELIEYIAGVFGFTYGTHYHYRLSLRDRNNTKEYYDNDAAWEKSEMLLRDLLKKHGKEFVEAKGHAVFYGPKIDIQMKNVNGKEDTAFTVQYDFCMPDRFDLSYTDKDGSKKRAFVVHRSSIGAIERIMAFLIEHYAGAFPLWLSPVQIAILPIGETQKKYATEIYEQLRQTGIRAELHAENVTLNKRIVAVKKHKIPYFVVIGDKEINSKTVTLESRDTGKSEMVPVQDLLTKLTKEIADKR
ncbi:threonine--tRNA ligase [bacterium]|nr:threonine--tRNA ligase [bacterium]|tara:strand:+ start:17182 stop:18450 length:1269 start_codon:yes stop_codon:yes gene_type:complete